MTTTGYRVLAALVASVVGGCSDPEWSPLPVTSPLVYATPLIDWVEDQLRHYQTYGSCRIFQSRGGYPIEVRVWNMDCTLRSHLIDGNELQTGVFELAFSAIEGAPDEPLRYFRLIVDGPSDAGEKEVRDIPIADLSCAQSDIERYRKSVLECKTNPLRMDLRNSIMPRSVVSSLVLSALEERVKAQERKMRR